VWGAPLEAEYDFTHRYKAGLDFGQTTDSTAMPVLDKTTKQQVALLHTNGLEWKEIRRQIADCANLWSHTVCGCGAQLRGIHNPCPACGKAKGDQDGPTHHRLQVTAEKNSIGQVNIELLQSDHELDILPFETTNATKAEIMAALHEELHAGLQLQDIPVQRHELSIFVSTQTSTGTWKLAAEGDGHDDTVIGLALANYESASGWLEFYRARSEAAKAQKQETR
jgi:hypothetical protein